MQQEEKGMNDNNKKRQFSVKGGDGTGVMSVSVGVGVDTVPYGIGFGKWRIADVEYFAV